MPQQKEYALLLLPLNSTYIEQFMLMSREEEHNLPSFNFLQVNAATVEKTKTLNKIYKRTIASRQLAACSLEEILPQSLLLQVDRYGIIPGTKKFYKYLFTKPGLDENLKDIRLHLLERLWTFVNYGQGKLEIVLRKIHIKDVEIEHYIVQHSAPYIIEATALETGQCLIAVEKPTSIHYKKLTKFVYNLCYTVAFCQVTGKLLYHPVFNSYQQKARLRDLNKTDPEILEFQEMAKTINETLYGKVDEAFTTKDTTAIKALNMLLEHQAENLPWYQSVDRFLAKKQTLPVGKDFFQKHQEFFDKDLGEVAIILDGHVKTSSTTFFTAPIDFFHMDVMIYETPIRPYVLTQHCPIPY